jgi:hypothetical protein
LSFMRIKDQSNKIAKIGIALTKLSSDSIGIQSNPIAIETHCSDTTHSQSA